MRNRNIFTAILSILFLIVSSTITHTIECLPDDESFTQGKCLSSWVNSGCSCPAGKIRLCCSNYQTIVYSCRLYNPGHYPECWVCTYSESSTSYCYNSSTTCSCCTPGACTGCTPRTPSGYTTTNTGCPSTTRTCTGSNGCTSCTISKTFYQIDPNVVPSPPPYASMIVDGVSYQLSTDPNNPTRIKYPSSGDNIKVSVPPLIPPSSSGGVGYKFTVDNYGLNDEWAGGTVCVGVDGEDFCYEGTSSQPNFSPSSKLPLDTLKQNADGQIAVQYYSRNLCNTTKKYSATTTGYYVVDNLPEEEDDDGDDNGIPEVFDLTSETTISGCTSGQYTGLEINNPVNIKIEGSDPDGNSEIAGALVWLSTDTSTPSLVTLSDSYSSTPTSDIGLLVVKNGGSWDTPLVYAVSKVDETTVNWGLLQSDMVLKNSLGEDIVRVSDVLVQEGASVIFTFKMEFVNQTSLEHAQGLYNVKSMILDTYQLNSNILDQSHITTKGIWGVDLLEPQFEYINQEILSPQDFNLSWKALGTDSKITDVVVNGYRRDASISDSLVMVSPDKGEIALGEVEDEDTIGFLGKPNQWEYNNLSSTPLEDDADIYIGNNELGLIDMYVTAYDQGCNSVVNSHIINLNPWIATKGGVMYSSGSVTLEAKDLGSVPDSYFEIAGESTIRNVLKDELDLGTELMTSRQAFLRNLIHTNLNAVRATGVYDSSEKKNFWFNYLTRKLEGQKGEIKKVTSLLNCAADEICLWESENSITIPSNSVCSGNVLVVSKSNITIQPDLTNADGSSGCIFLSMGDILIKGGTYQSASGIVGYDYIEGYFIAENRITVELADTGVSLRDGLEIRGGVVGLGRELTGESAVSIYRNLRLFNYINPTLVISHDTRYSKISERFFNTEAPMYKQETGFKPF